MSLISTHPLETKGWDGQLYIMASIITGVQQLNIMVSIITGVQGMSLMSTHSLGTKGWDGQLYIMVSIITGFQGMYGSTGLSPCPWTVYGNTAHIC